MPKYCETLDGVFHALSSPVRRDVIEMLGRQEATLTDLGRHFDMAQPSLLQHLRVLEEAGLVTSTKVGRSRTYALRGKSLIDAEHWMDARRREWEERTDRLEAVVMMLKAEETQ